MKALCISVWLSQSRVAALPDGDATYAAMDGSTQLMVVTRRIGMRWMALQRYERPDRSRGGRRDPIRWWLGKRHGWGWALRRWIECVERATR